MLKNKGVVITPADLPGANWPERMKELNLNLLGIHSGGGPAHDVLEVLGHTATEEFRNRITSLGLGIEYEQHSSHMLLPRRLFAEHPEYFIHDRKWNRRSDTGNWCLANPGTRAEIRKNAQALAKTLVSTTHRHFFWGGDANASWCHCPECCQYSPVEQSLLTANLMAEALREIDPQASVAFLVYGEAIDIPELVKPAPGVFLEFAPMQRCYQHTLDDPACRVNRPFWNVLKYMVEHFNPEEAHVLEYWIDSSYYCFPKDQPRKRPVFLPEMMAKDVALYQKLGIRDLTSFAVNMDKIYFDEFGDEDVKLYADVLNHA